MVKEYKYTVCTSCMTYNQASFIEDTLRGFAMQDTLFPIAYCVVDDASTDGEPDVLRRWAEDNLFLSGGVNNFSKHLDYGDLIAAPLKGHDNLLFVILLLRENHYGKKDKNRYISEWYDNAKYRAICEGDDYWIHPRKLQMQIDFMERHPDYVMCHTDFNLSSGGYRNHNVYIAPDDFYFPYSVQKRIQVGTLTSLYRTSIYHQLPHLNIGKGWPMGDYPLWIELSHEGKIKYIPEVTACYRITENSASHGSIEKEIRFYEAAVEIKKFYADYYKVVLQQEEIYHGLFTSIMKSAYKHNRSDVAVDYYKRAKEENMVSYKMRLFYFATVCKPFRWLIKKYRKESIK